MRHFLISVLITFGVLSFGEMILGFVISPNSLQEFGYELGYYMRTGEHIEAHLVEFYIVESEGDFIGK